MDKCSFPISSVSKKINSFLQLFATCTKVLGVKIATECRLAAFASSRVIKTINGGMCVLSVGTAWCIAWRNSAGVQQYSNQEFLEIKAWGELLELGAELRLEQSGFLTARRNCSEKATIIVAPNLGGVYGRIVLGSIVWCFLLGGAVHSRCRLEESDCRSA